MMESSKSKEKSITKDRKNHFRLRKEIDYTAIKDIRNLYRLEKNTKAIKDYLEILRILLRMKKKININQ